VQAAWCANHKTRWLCCSILTILVVYGLCKPHFLRRARVHTMYPGSVAASSQYFWYRVCAATSSAQSQSTYYVPWVCCSILTIFLVQGLCSHIFCADPGYILCTLGLNRPAATLQHPHNISGAGSVQATFSAYDTPLTYLLIITRSHCPWGWTCCSS
jgi:hypothetical protein